MRVATNNYGVVWTDDAIPSISAISLGYDFTAEHEWGVEGLKQLLGVPAFNVEDFLCKEAKRKNLGVAARRITSSDHVYTGSFDSDGKTYYYFYVAYLCNPENISDIVKQSFSSCFDSMIEKAGVATAWSGEDLCFVTTDERIPNYFYDAIKKNNLFIGQMAGYPFGGKTLTLALISETDEELKEAMVESDLNSIELLKRDKKTGIKERLGQKHEQWLKDYPGAWKSPWSFIALSPQVKEGDIIYWLNPENQRLLDAGWYTVEELQEWANSVPGKVVSEACWPKLNWICRHRRFSTLEFQYKYFFDIKPEWHYVQRFPNKKMIKGTPKFFDEDLDFVMSHVLYLFYRDYKDRLDIGESIETMSCPKEDISDRVFGLFEACTFFGLGSFDAINTPAEKTNFSWLTDILDLQAWFLVAKEVGFVTDGEEERFLKDG